MSSTQVTMTCDDSVYRERAMRESRRISVGPISVAHRAIWRLPSELIHPIKNIPLYQATLRQRQIFRLRVTSSDGFENEFTVGGISKTRECGIA